MSLKILHTADWHIGKKLHEYTLHEDHRLFLNWLLDLITAEKIDYLVVSGDIFDLANPSQEALKLYYEFLARLSSTSCAAVITAGNHDSPAVIDAPSDLLNALKIHVTGNVPDDKEKMLLPLTSKAGKVEAVLATIPYLRDKDLRKAVEGESYDDRIEAVREGIGSFYSQLSELMMQKSPGLLHLGMGHLYVQGSALSDSEREIQIGNLAGISEKAFPENFAYVALGHIHKAQNVGGASRIRYSGSPIPLSFSEKDYNHRVILLELEEGSIAQKDIPVKKERELISLKGSFRTIKSRLKTIENSYSLPLLLDLQFEEDIYTPGLPEMVENLVKEITGEMEVVNIRIHYKDSPWKNNYIFEYESYSQEMSPEHILSEVIGEREDKTDLMRLFMEIRQEAEEPEA
jgi:exonuclease SbcD